jgi:hypothetical protein
VAAAKADVTFGYEALFLLGLLGAFFGVGLSDSGKALSPLGWPLFSLGHQVSPS